MLFCILYCWLICAGFVLIRCRSRMLYKKSEPPSEPEKLREFVKVQIAAAYKDMQYGIILNNATMSVDNETIARLPERALSQRLVSHPLRSARLLPAGTTA